MNSDKAGSEYKPRERLPPQLYYLCPYDVHHQIRKERFGVHIFKCRGRYLREVARTGGEVEMEPCKYNFFHQVPCKEIMEHQHFCPDQHTFTLPTVSSTTLRKHKEVTANVVKALQPLKDKIKECPENVTTFLPEKNQEILEDLKAFFLQASDEEDN